MAQDTLARAFVTLGLMAAAAAQPAGVALSVASNLWLNRMRQTRELPAVDRRRGPRAGDACGPPRDA